MFLDPAKLLIIGVVALVVLGPDQLPKMAETAGSLWHEFKRWRTSLDDRVRAAFPDLPSTHEIAAAVRSPIFLLDRLADEAGESGLSTEAAAGDPSPTLESWRPAPADAPITVGPSAVVSSTTGQELDAGRKSGTDLGPESTDAISMN
jgi:Sec-independent protein translocase protein TatA